MHGDNIVAMHVWRFPVGRELFAVAMHASGQLLRRLQPVHHRLVSPVPERRDPVDHRWDLLARPVRRSHRRVLQRGDGRVQPALAGGLHRIEQHKLERGRGVWGEPLHAAAEGRVLRARRLHGHHAERLPRARVLDSGSSCSNGICGNYGRCCTNAGACFLSTSASCTAAGSSDWLTFDFGGTCTPNTCPQPGACCSGTDRTCSMLTQNNCGFSAWLGVGTTCTANTCSPPSNDLCSAAQRIDVNTPPLAGTVFGATGADITDCSSTEVDVWYSFQPPAPGSYRVRLRDSALAIAAFSGSACPPTPFSEFSCVLANSDNRGENFLYLNLSSTTPILLRVGASARPPFFPVGNFRIDVQPYTIGPAPANDACNSSSPLVISGVAATGNNLDALSNTPIRICIWNNVSGSFTGRDVFHRFIPTCTGNYMLSTCGSSFHTVIDVLSDCSGSSSSLLYCNDGTFDFGGNGDFCQPGNFSDPHGVIQSAAFTAGQLYFIRIGGYGNLQNSEMGTYQLLITPAATCNLGACCDGSICSLRTAAECVGASQHHAGENVACNLPGNNMVPFEKGDFNQSGTTGIQDIFDFFTAYCDDDLSADINASGALTVQNLFEFLAAFFGGLRHRVALLAALSKQSPHATSTDDPEALRLTNLASRAADWRLFH